MASEQTNKNWPIIAIVGPTAVGKTAVALELAATIGGEIVSADSMAVYSHMDIGTAKPTADEQSRARFHLIDVADPAKPFSVGEFQQLAQRAIDDILKRNPPAIVVGGSGLYVRAAIDGLDMSMPADNQEFRARMVQEARLYGNEQVHARLAAIDPVSAGRVHPNNLKRVIRALEIYEETGKRASELFEADAKREPRYPNTRFFGLTMDRKQLYERIEERVDAMMETGLVQEVSRLLEMDIDPNSIAMQGLGYKEIVGYLRGDIGLDEVVELLKKNTRRFAKRQYTWFRAESRCQWIDVGGRTAAEVSLIIKESLLK
ncbi:MAG: tRNA (adenosine(37)-N6)-dimethylallyltransferase MiaA [Armatimonadota bacterium]|nr:tRNA (adenosine(37)-N6)-dimethylallyltransferase MiaA [bacterium]